MIQTDNTALRRAEPIQDRSILDLVGEVSELSLALLKKEVELATVEIEGRVERKVEEAKSLGGGVALIAGAAFASVLTLTGALLALFLFGFEFSPAVALWLAPLVVTTGLGVAGWLTYQRALEKIKGSTALPKRAIQNTKEDLECLKN